MKLKRKQYRDLGTFFHIEIERIQGNCPMGSISDLDRQNAWAIAEQKMLNYLLVLIIELNLEIEKLKKENNDNSN